MSELLLEIFSEEIPARMQTKAAEDLLKLVQGSLIDAGYRPDGAKAFATPRRLSLVITGLQSAQKDRVEERKGPKVGAPEKAIAGFLKSAGLGSVDECETKDDGKGPYYIVRKEIKGRLTTDVIAKIVPEVIAKFPWPKSMRWGDGEMRWVRPLHSILCCYDGEVVNFECGGLKAGDITYGHRFMAGEPVQVRSFEAYETALRRAYVILDGEERREKILGEATALCQTLGLELVEDAALLGEVAGLAEWPTPLIGTFDEKFLTVPDEVLTASMRGHQKYFSVRDPKTGRLANKFVCVANIEAPDGGKAMRVGYERVLTARLSDAWFLYNQDLKTPLEDHAAKLDEVTFFEGLGSLGDKVDRLKSLSADFATLTGADKAEVAEAAALSKADLVTGMVYEFPELQGLMGRYYAQAQKRSAAVATAIEEHYRPVGQNDAVPSSDISAALALAEKLDALTGFFAIDEMPTGSKDPFALRRAALGIIRIVLDKGYRISFSSMIEAALDLYRKQQGSAFGPGKTGEILPFFHDRLKVFLRDNGFRHDHVDAVRRRNDGTVEDDLVLIVKKLEALSATLKTDDGANLIAAYKRAGNILKAEQKKEKPASSSIAKNLLTEPEEKALFEAIEQVEAKAMPLLAKEEYKSAMEALATLRAPLDGFFEKVTVNVDDAPVRANRLALLDQIISTCNQVADLSKIEG